MKPSTKLALQGLAVVVTSYLCYILLGYFVPRSSFPQLIALCLVLFAGMFLLHRLFRDKEFHVIVLVGVLFRVSLLLAPPFWSDDYMRFVWDGRLISEGENPYLWLPSETHQSEMAQSLGLDELYDGLNSKEYYTVYPPIHQSVFLIGAWAGGGNLQLEVFFMRIVVILFEIMVLVQLKRLLERRGRQMNVVAFYAFNPLVVLELTGNLHFEGIVLAFLLWAYNLWYSEKKRWWSPIAFGLAVGVKLLPLIFLPLLLRRMQFKKALIYYILVGVTFVILFLPFVSKELMANMMSSVDLYFRSFEFNASLYYLIRWVGIQAIGYNPIQWVGPLLGVLVVAVTLYFSFFRSKESLFRSALFVLTAYFLLSTTVHPWYITTILVLGLASGIRYPIYWSFLVLLSYAHYWGGGYAEHYLLITMEYLVLFGLMIYEGRQDRKLLTPHS